jgi:hypothetical protein
MRGRGVRVGMGMGLGLGHRQRLVMLLLRPRRVCTAFFTAVRGWVSLGVGIVRSRVYVYGGQGRAGQGKGLESIVLLCV